MQFKKENKINAESLNSFNEDLNLEPAKRFDEKKDNPNLFNIPNQLCVLKALDINQQVSISDYIHLPHKEPFDEN